MARIRHRSRRRKKSDSRPKTGPREFWSGTISFGLVSVPVQLMPAQTSDRVSLRELTLDGALLRRRFFCPEHERLITNEEIVRGYEYQTNQYVVVTDKELEDLEPLKSREIDLKQFVALDELSPRFCERSYILAPDGDSNKAYRLLAGVLENSRRAGVATFVMREREYLIAIIGEDGILRGEILRFADEVRQPEDLGLSFEGDIDRNLVKRFERLIETHAKDQLDSRELKDNYSERLRQLVDRKRKRRTDVVQLQSSEEETVEPEEDIEGEDLLDTIRRSLGAGAKQSEGRGLPRNRRPTRSGKKTAQGKAAHRPVAKTQTTPRRGRPSATVNSTRKNAVKGS
jgi:DNA end-binding protein Ku